MVSYAAGSRYLSPDRRRVHELLRLVLRPAAGQPAGLGRADRRARVGRLVQLARYIIAWGSNVPQTRTPDAHFFTEVRYKGAKTVAVTPDYSEVAKLADIWMHPKQGTDAAVAMAMGHVILKEFYFPDDGQAAQRVLRRLRAPLHRPADAGDAEGAHAARRRARRWCPTATCAPATSTASSARPTTRSGRRWPSTRPARWCCPTARSASAGAPKAAPTQGKWNLEDKEARHGSDVKLKLSVLEGGAQAHDVVDVAFPYFGGIDTPHFKTNVQQGDVNWCARAGACASAWARKATSARRWWPPCSTCRWRSTASPAACGELARKNYRRRRALHAGLAGTDHRRAARAADHRGAPVRRERAQDARQVDGHHRRGDEPLVPRRHELPRRHQHADDVRLHRQERRRLGALRGPGEAAPADRLDGAGLRAGLDPPAAADEQHQLLLRPHRPVALREARHGRGAVAAGRQEARTAAA